MRRSSRSPRDRRRSRIIRIRSAGAGRFAHAAAERGDLLLLKRLVAAGASVEARTEYGRTPIMLAATRDRVDVVAWLMFDGHADWDAEDREGKTALAFAIETESRGVRSLLETAKARESGRLEFVRRTIMFGHFIGKAPPGLASQPEGFLISLMLIAFGCRQPRSIRPESRRRG